MTITRFGAMVAIVAVVSACQRGEVDSFQYVQPDLAELSPEQAESFDRYLATLNELEERRKKKGGFMACEGYLTRSEDDDYCTYDIPEDWVPFEFNGTTYFFQPLASL